MIIHQLIGELHFSSLPIIISRKKITYVRELDQELDKVWDRARARQSAEQLVPGSE